MPSFVAENVSQTEFNALTTPRSTPGKTDDKLPWTFKHSFEVKVQRTFHDLGRRVAARPRSWIAGSSIFALVCFLGLFAPNMKLEARSEYLWVPVDSFAFETFEYQKRTFDSTEANVILAMPSGNGGNILTKQSFDALWTLDEAIRAIELEEGSGKGKSHKDLCQMVGDSCLVLSPLQYWASKAAYQAEVVDDAALLRAVSRSTFANGFPVSRRTLFGNYEEDLDTGDMLVVEGSQLIYILSGSRATTDEGAEWAAKFLKVAGVKGAPASPELKQIHPGLNVYPNSYYSLDDEIGRVVSVDIPLVMIEYVIMFIFVALAFSYGQKNSKVTIASACIGSVLLSTAAGYGLCAACGIPLTVLVFILPFILVGIGVDDGFVIVTSYRQLRAQRRAQKLQERQQASVRSEEHKEEHERTHVDDDDEDVGELIAEGLGKCAMSIVYTTLTDVIAFSFGCIGSIPAIRYFCAYAAVAVAFDFFFQLTFFVAVLVLDERADAAKAKKSRQKKLEAGDAIVETTQSSTALAPPTPQSALGASSAAASSSESSRSTWEKYVNLVTSRVGIAAVVVITVGFTAFNAWALNNLQSDFDVGNVIPDDSYIQDYLKESRKTGLFWDSSISYNTVFKNVDLADAAVQRKAIEVLTSLSEDTKKSEGPVDWWLNDFSQWATTQASLVPYVTSDGLVDGSSSEEARTAFNTGVKTFLSVYPYDRHAVNVALRDPEDGGDGSIKAARGSLSHYGLLTAARKIKAMVAAYDTCEDSDLGIDKATPFASTYIFITQFMVIQQETIMNMLLSFAAVALISVPVLGSTKAVLIVLLCVMAIDIDLLGLLWLNGYDLNSITMVSLVMAIGLVVDYLAHIVHYFMGAADRDPKQRMITAFDEVGGAVLLGGATTFVGIMPLAFASSFVYRVFFRLFFCIVTLGIFHGFVVVPCLLISVPPKPNEESTSSLQRAASNENAITAASPQGRNAKHATHGEETL